MTAPVPAFALPNLPDDLTERDQWVLWRLEMRDGKPTKVPYQANGNRAKSDDPETWNTFEAVAAAWMKAAARYQGIGFVFSAADPFAGIDFDDCIDQGGALKPWVRPMIECFADSYAEISPSGHGAKLWVKARLDGPGRRAAYQDGAIEIYDRGRFFTTTGHALNGAPLQVEEHQTDVTALYALISGAATDQPKNKAKADLKTQKTVTEGARYEYLQSAAAQYRAKGMDGDEIYAALAAINRQRCKPSKSDDVVQELAKWAATLEPGKSRVVQMPAPNPKPKPLQAIDARTIFKADYPEPEFVIEDLLTKGVTFCCGRPKVGKSWMVLQLALAVARGSVALGNFAVKTPGRVMYCGLEEPPRRTSNRLKMFITEDEPYLENIHMIYRLQPLLAGGAAELDEYLTRNPSELLIIDTFLSVLQASGKRDVLRSDYAEVRVLAELAEKHKTAVLVVHHLRKMGAEYALDAVAGTTGLTASADSIWALTRTPEGAFKLAIQGRDMENREYEVAFGVHADQFGWRVIAEGNEIGMSQERKDILLILEQEGPQKPVKLAQLLGNKNYSTTRRLLQKMYQDDLITKCQDGRYRLSSLSSVNSVNERKSVNRERD